MKLNELLTESQHTELMMLKEGPIGAIGRGIAKGIGGLAKGAGMIAGIGKGLKTAYQKGKATSAAHIGGDVPKSTDPEAQATYDKEYAKLTTPQAQPAAAAAAPAQTAASAAAAQSAAPAQTAAPAAGATPDAATQARIAAAPQGYDTETGKPNPAAKPAAAPAAEPAAAEQPAAAPATDITKIQQTISKLPPEQKKEIVDILQADPAIKKSAPAPAAEKPAASAQPAAAPAAGGEQKPGFLKTATDKIQDKAKAKAGTQPSQAEIDADRARIMGPTSDSIIRRRPSIVEGFSLYRKK